MTNLMTIVMTNIYKNQEKLEITWKSFRGIQVKWHMCKPRAQPEYKNTSAVIGQELISSAAFPEDGQGCGIAPEYTHYVDYVL